MDFTAEAVQKVTVEAVLRPACRSCGAANPHGAADCGACGSPTPPAVRVDVTPAEANEPGLLAVWRRLNRLKRRD